VLGCWQLDVKAVRERMYGAPTALERERWHAIWLLARGWSAAQVAEALFIVLKPIFPSDQCQ
jgi:hypothetical protein